MTIKNNAKPLPKIKVGDRVFVTMRYGKLTTKYDGVIEAIYKYHISINTGKYKITVSLQDIICGHAKIEMNGGVDVGQSA